MNFRGKVGSQFDYALLHAPYQKLVRKAYHRIYELETQEKKAPKEDSEISYEEKVKPGLGLSLECGNMYTGSVWASLNSLLVSKDVVPDYGKIIPAAKCVSINVVNVQYNEDYTSGK